MTLLLQLNLGMAWGPIVAGIEGPFIVADRGIYVPGAVDKAAYKPGADDVGIYRPGAEDKDVAL